MTASRQTQARRLAEWRDRCRLAENEASRLRAAINEMRGMLRRGIYRQHVLAVADAAVRAKYVRRTASGDSRSG